MLSDLWLPLAQEPLSLSLFHQASWALWPLLSLSLFALFPCLSPAASHRLLQNTKHFSNLSLKLIYNISMILTWQKWPDENTWTDTDSWRVSQKTWRDSSPKNESSVIICSHSGCSKPVRASIIYWTQKKIFWRMSVSKQLILAIDLHETNAVEVNGYHQQDWNNPSVSNFFG